MKVKTALFLFFILFLVSFCSDPLSSTGNPQWVDDLIAEFKSQPVGNPPQSIWRYSYKDRVVYYVPPQCCDQFSTLYDSKGNVICAPDGGFSGRGNGKCTDFFRTCNNEKLIWKDNRERL